MGDVFLEVTLTQRIHTESLDVNVKSSVLVLDSAYSGPGGAGCLNTGARHKGSEQSENNDFIKPPM